MCIRDRSEVSLTRSRCFERLATFVGQALCAKKFQGPKLLNLWHKGYVFDRFMLLGKQIPCNGNRVESREIVIPRIGLIQCWKCWDWLQAICPRGESTEDQRLLYHRVFVGIQSGSVREWHGRCLDKRTKHRIYLSNGRSKSSISLSAMIVWACNSPSVNGVWLLSRHDDVLVANWLTVHSFLMIKVFGFHLVWLGFLSTTNFSFIEIYLFETLGSSQRTLANSLRLPLHLRQTNVVIIIAM